MNNMLIIRLLFLCFILNSFVISGSAKPPDPKSLLSQFKMVCDFHSVEDGLNELPKVCTALATSNESPGSIDELKPLRKPTTKMMRFSADKNFDQWKSSLQNFEIVDTYTTIIQGQKLDAICFDFMYCDGESSETVSSFSENVATFLRALRKKNPGVLLGLGLPKEGDKIPTAFDLNNVDSSVDFYIVKTSDYRGCTSRHIHGDYRTTTQDDMEMTISFLQESNYKFQKILLLVDINVYTHDVWKFSNRNTILTYTNVCTENYSRHRTICKDSLSQLYDKGKLVQNYGMLGLYVVYGNADDLTGQCQCVGDDRSTSFPVLKVLSKASLGQPGGGILSCD